MTGIVVALGGRATQTSRGLSLKNFVKKGCSSGQVSVQLRNKGSDAYKSAEYGDSIIIERKIMAEGGSSYKIKSTEGKVISASRTEVDHIVDHFNIQVDNPVSLLNQDTSRHLLNSNDASDLYKFFMKATSLEQISSDYWSVMENKDIGLALLQKKEQNILDVRAELRRREARFIAVKQIKDVKEQIQELKGERVWAEVIENEKVWRGIEGTFLLIWPRGWGAWVFLFGEGRLCNKVKEIVILSSSQQLRNKVSPLLDDTRCYHPRIKPNQIGCYRLRKVVQKVVSCSTFCNRILIGLSPAKFYPIRSQYLHNLQQPDLLQDGFKWGHLYALHCVSTLFEEMLRNKLNAFLARFTVGFLSLTVWATNNMFCFANCLFKGFHVHLKDQKWSYAIEVCLKHLAYGFCVTNYQDMHTMKSLITQTCQAFFPVVLVCPFQETVYDFSSYKPNCQFPTILDLLDIDDPVIANCLIDQLHIETALAIESRKQACDFIWSRDAPSTQAFALGGDHIIGGRCAKCIASVKEPRNYFSSNSQDDIRTINEEISQSRTELECLMDRRKTLEKTLKQKINELQETNKAKKKMQTSIASLQVEISELKESFEEEVSPDISVLETDLELYAQRLEDCTQQSQIAEEELAQASATFQKQQEINTQHTQKVSVVFEKADSLKEELTSLNLIMDQERIRKNHHEKERRKFERKITENEKERDRLVKLAEQKADVASKHFPRVETTRSVTDLETEILKKQKYIEEEERNRGSAEKITKEFKEICDRYSEILKNTKNIQKLHKCLKNQMEKRMKYLKEKRKILASHTSQFFTRHLSQRGFSGYVSFDHNEETLELIVNVHKGPRHVHGGVDESTRVMKSLSGGERSVSTICFLTALWGTMESPFRCLDEFDVFMDLYNRKVIMKMVLELAALPEEKHRQFIFLTPQDMSYLPIDRSVVRIFKLDDPDR
ncbi:unnamed protein product [Porites evermanni]|uniref:RecF/RecN/SMC N-terminal domain-containing protein n=1 Tax=Porites evermanni TaxID=104178 RepID=A0ABN8M175_9CNID|nr:unnamed protein product [Porites evermanni]